MCFNAGEFSMLFLGRQRLDGTQEKMSQVFCCYFPGGRIRLQASCAAAEHGGKLSLTYVD